MSSRRAAGSHEPILADTIRREKAGASRGPRPGPVHFPVSSKADVLTVDRGLAAAGLATALGSMVFAAFMIGQNTPPARLEWLDIPRYSLAGRNSPAHFQPTGSMDSFGQTMDYNVTGSISRHDIGRNAQSTWGPTGAARSLPSTNEQVSNYILRFVHKNMALVQTGHGFYVVRRGTRLPVAGQVLSIERRGNVWLLVATRAIITETGSNFF